MSGSMDWLEILKAFGSLAGSASGGMGAGGAGLGLPDASAATGATTGGMGMGGAGLPGGGVVEPAPGMVMPQLNTDVMMPGPTTFQPLPVPPVPPTAARPVPSLAVPPVPPAATPNPSTTTTAPDIDLHSAAWHEGTGQFAPRSWWDRNVGDTWDAAWKEDPKTGLSKGQKALEGIGSFAGKLGGGGGSAAPPVISGGGGGASIHPTGKFDAGQAALAREQARQLLMARATLNAPWLKRPLVGGLMG